MIRRLILLSLAVYAVVALSKANSKRTTQGQNDFRALPTGNRKVAIHLRNPSTGL